MGIDLSPITALTGAVAAHTASGKGMRTTGDSKRMLRADALAGTVAMLGPDIIPVPYPAGARLSPEGVASLHLHGLGLTADFSLVMNTYSPSDNYLMVTEPGGGVSQYRLSPVAGKTIDSWVIAIRPSAPEPWTRLDHAAHLIVAGEESNPQS